MSKDYATRSAAKAALRKAGLQNISHTIDLRDNRYVPMFWVDQREDLDYLSAKGFKVILHDSAKLSA